VTIAAAGLLALTIAAPGAAARSDRFREPILNLFPDVDRELVILMNIPRDTYCTPEVIDWEEAVIQWVSDFDDWVAGGQVGPEPPFPDDPPGGFPEGEKLILIQSKETGKGAIVEHLRGKKLYSEIWPMVEDPPGIGPCTDTNAADTPLVGTGSWMNQDNELLGSGSRGNAFGGWGQIRADGHTYKWRFHTNSRCYTPEDGPPRCERYRSSFR
jgi:hypothetical protein